jgi:hypothetical protein
MNMIVLLVGGICSSGDVLLRSLSSRAGHDGLMAGIRLRRGITLPGFYGIMGILAQR